MRMSVGLSVLFMVIPVSSVLVDPRSTGVIGSSVSDVNRMKRIEIPSKESGCRWFGTAPVCMGECPGDWIEVRSAKNPNAPFTTVTEKGKERFGAPCLPFTKKLYCCGINELDRTWSGDWISSKTDEIISCRYGEEGSRKCGQLHCGDSVNVTVYQIEGIDCTALRIEKNGSELEGLASNGLIFWRNSGNKLGVDRWFKISK